MRLLHVNQVGGALHRMFDGQIELSDVPASGPDRAFDVSEASDVICHCAKWRLKPCRDVDLHYGELTTKANALYPGWLLPQLVQKPKEAD